MCGTQTVFALAMPGVAAFGKPALRTGRPLAVAASGLPAARWRDRMVDLIAATSAPTRGGT